MYFNRKYWERRWRQDVNYARIQLPNGAHCNANFFWYAVDLGILSEDD